MTHMFIHIDRHAHRKTRQGESLFSDMESYSQTGLEASVTANPPASDMQLLGITGNHHQAQQSLWIIFEGFLHLQYGE